MLEAERAPELTAAQLRRLMVSEFRDWLGTRTSRDKRPFQADTISAYADAAIALDAWMSREAIEEDFTACDTPMLNRFFAACYAAHGQGGTNTKQRNLRHLFTWPERDHDHPHPYTEDLQRYSPAKNRPSTLAGGFIADLFEVTGGGKTRRFEDARDHAIIRMLTEGVRRTELVQLQTNDLPVDVIAQPFVRVVPLEGGPGVGRGPDRAARAGDGPGASGLTAGAAGAPAGRLPRAVAGVHATGGRSAGASTGRRSSCRTSTTRKPMPRAWARCPTGGSVASSLEAGTGAVGLRGRLSARRWPPSTMLEVGSSGPTPSKSRGAPRSAVPISIPARPACSRSSASSGTGR